MILFITIITFKTFSYYYLMCAYVFLNLCLSTNVHSIFALRLRLQGSLKVTVELLYIAKISFFGTTPKAKGKNSITNFCVSE